MDPCPFVRLTVTSLALKTPTVSKPARSVIHPYSSSPCFCSIKLKHFPTQTAAVPESISAATSAVFHLGKPDLDKLSGKKLLFSGKPVLKVSIYTGGVGSTCGLRRRREREIGRVLVPLDLSGSEVRSCVLHNGWVEIGKETRFHMCVRVDPDPRFVFEFEGDPECSPQVFQVQGTIRQPVFTCKFSFRSNERTRSLSSDLNGSKKWLSSFGSERERPGKERKGWSVTVHDLSGSPVAAASMVTPFVASPGSDRVSRSNPGSWLVLRPGNDGTWKPWGRLEAWRERGSRDGLGLRFELVPPDTASGAGLVLAESTLSSQKGGKFSVDLCHVAAPTGVGAATSPASCSPRSGSGDCSMWPYCMYRGFVMSATVKGEGRKKGGKPTVHVSVNHVGCTEDAAAFVALSAAVDLSMDACRLFSQKLRKELCPNEDSLV